MSNSTSVLETEKEMLPVKLRSLLKEKNMTQTELAKRMNMSRQNLQGYLNGQIKIIPYDRLVKLAEIFGVSTDYLLTDTTTRSPSLDIRTAVKVTGLSEDAIYQLRRAPAGTVIEYLLSDENSQIWQDLRAYFGTSLPEKDVFLEVDPYNDDVKKTDGKTESANPNIYKVSNREIVEQVLIDKIVDELKKQKKGFRRWFINSYSYNDN